MIRRLQAWAKNLKTDTYALYFACRDPRTPLVAKIVAGLVAAYALSPIDLIPDFIPVIGYLDDLILVPLGVVLALRLVPKVVMQECRERARREVERPVSRMAAVIIVALWLGALVLLVVWLLRR